MANTFQLPTDESGIYHFGRKLSYHDYLLLNRVNQEILVYNERKAWIPAMQELLSSLINTNK